jgi:hypothetical protein
MGNRGTVIFADGKEEFSPAIYLHWNVGAEMAEPIESSREKSGPLGLDSSIDNETPQPRIAILGLDASGELVQREVSSFDDLIRIAEDDWPIDGSIIEIIGDEGVTEVGL